METRQNEHAGCWKSLAPEQRPGFQQAVYPNGLRFDGQAFGTAESSWAFGYLQTETTTENGMASPTGLEPVLPPRNPSEDNESDS